MSPKIESQRGNSDERTSAPLNEQIEEFEAKLHEDNMHLFRQFRLKDFLVEVKEQDPNIKRIE
jgi:hypothetical protein